MNINLEQPLFRFIVPPAILYGGVLFADTSEKITSFFIFDDLTSSIITFLALGFIISAIGTVTARIIDYKNRPCWFESKEELEYWERIGGGNEYTQKKIENTWGFYSLNINSTIAIICAIFIILIDHQPLHPKEILLTVFLVLFILLARFNYNKICGFCYWKPKK